MTNTATSYRHERCDDGGDAEAAENERKKKKKTNVKRQLPLVLGEVLPVAGDRSAVFEVDWWDSGVR